MAGGAAYSDGSGLILGIRAEVLNKKGNHDGQKASDCCHRLFRYEPTSCGLQNLSLGFSSSSWVHVDPISLHFALCHCHSGSWGAFMSVKYLLGSTGIENRIAQSILLSMERA